MGNSTKCGLRWRCSKLVAVAYAGILAAGLNGPATSQTSQTSRVWLGGRYDATRVLVYFNAGKFGDTTSGREIAPPKAAVIFPPREMTAAQIAQFHETGAVEPLKLGSRYDLLLGNGRVVIVVLTSLVGFPGDEQTGNNSYVGALGTFADSDARLLTSDYYALRRHDESRRSASSNPPTGRTRAGLAPSAAMAAGLRSRFLSLVYAKAKTDTIASIRSDVAAGPLRLDAVSPFTLVDGARRYYFQARIEAGAHCLLFDAFLSSESTNHLLALGTSGCAYDLPKEHATLLNAVDLGDGRTGLVVRFPGGDGMALSLLEYRDGMTLYAMPVLWSISASE